MIHFDIPGTPQSQLRPRAVRRGKGVMMYDPKQVKEYKEYVALIARQHAPASPLDGALDVRIRFYMPIPRSTTKKDREAMKQEIMLPAKRPDADNLCKSVLDAGNKILYEDDSQIVRLTAEKFYSDNPRVELKIWEVF